MAPKTNPCFFEPSKQKLGSIPYNLCLICNPSACRYNSPADNLANHRVSVANTTQSRKLHHQRSQAINTPTTSSKKCQAPRKAFFGYFLWLWKESYPVVGRDRRFKSLEASSAGRGTRDAKGQKKDRWDTFSQTIRSAVHPWNDE